MSSSLASFLSRLHSNSKREAALRLCSSLARMQRVLPAARPTRRSSRLKRGEGRSWAGLPVSPHTLTLPAAPPPPPWSRRWRLPRR